MRSLTRPDARRCRPAKALRYQPQRNSSYDATVGKRQYGHVLILGANLEGHAGLVGAPQTYNAVHVISNDVPVREHVDGSYQLVHLVIVVGAERHGHAGLVGTPEPHSAVPDASDDAPVAEHCNGSDLPVVGADLDRDARLVGPPQPDAPVAASSDNAPVAPQ